MNELADSRIKAPIARGVSSKSLTRIDEILAWSTKFLKEKGSPSARLDAELLMAHVVQCDRIELYTNFQKPLSLSERETLRSYLRRRGQGEPVAYILGKKSFWKYTFYVNPSVLIPRPETELLLEESHRVITNAIAYADERLRILDVGTGSGCLAVSLASSFENADVTAWDISQKALSLAQRNHRQICPGSSINFVCCDMLEPSAWEVEPFDLIVSNPPYVAEAHIAPQDQQGRFARAALSYEPRLALFAGKDGLVYYHSLARNAKRALSSSGRLIIEIGIDQSSAVQEILKTEGWEIEVIRDDLSSIPRTISARPRDV